MAQNNLDDHNSLPQALRQLSPLLQPLRRHVSAGPRLVGGTTFSGKAALDAAQVQILAQACLQGLDAARQVVFGWQKQGQSLADI